MQTDELFMRKALDRARLGEGKVLPNPMVGALIVRDGRILGQGHHACYGGIHAEAAALRDCREDPKGATLYVTLEPCCHRGEGKHNPPCTDAILKAQISRVVISRLDPNPAVSGRGAGILRQKGVEVHCGILEKESARLNRVYETLICTDRPYVHLKAALTLDGFLAAADGSSRWISGSESREKVMAFRSRCDGILTGRGTLYADLPSLTVRHPDNSHRNDPQPARIFLSTKGHIPGDWEKPGGPVLVYHDRSVSQPGCPESFQFTPVPAGENGLSLPDVLSDLRRRGIRQLLVEGGSRVYGSFIRSGLWDRLTLFIAPVLLGEGIPFSDGLDIGSITSKLHLKDVSSVPSGDDIMIDGYREALSCLPA